MDLGYGSRSIMGYGSGYGSWSMDRVWARDALYLYPHPHELV